MTAPAPDAGRIYLGWEYALVHPHPGPPPPRPVPPGPEQVSPGWLAAQQREERRLSLPLRLGGAASLALAGLTAGLGVPGVLNPALTAVGLTGFGALAAWCARGVWRGRLDLHARVDREEQRVARARAVQRHRLHGWQQEHAIAFRDWQARGQAFQAQAHWHGVALPAEIDRVDVAGGTQAGWSALLTMLAGLRLAAGGEVTVLDLAHGAAAQDLLAIARGTGTDPLVWVLPADLPRFELGRGLPRHALADVLAVAASAGGDPASPPDPAGLAQDTAVLERVATILGDQPSPGELLAGLRVLAQAGDRREDIRAGLISEAQAEVIAGLYGQAAADRVVGRALALEAGLRTLAGLGSSPVPLPPSRLRVVAVDAAAGLAAGHVLGSYLAAALTCLLREQRAPGPRWQHTVLVSGAETLCDAVLDRLSAACEATGTGLVLAYRTLPPHTRARLGRGNAAVAFMRLGNADDARAASEQIGTEHRFVVAQLTDTVGSSVTDTAGQAYTSTVGAASTAAVSRSASQTSGQSGGHGQSWAGLSAFAARTASAHGETSYSAATSDSVSLTEGINRGTAWGVQTALAVGANSALAWSSQRSREFLVEQHELQQLPPSAVVVSYAGPAGRRVVLADANPGILGLPTATLSTLDDAVQLARQAARDRAGGQRAGRDGAGRDGPGRDGPAWEGAAGAGEPEVWVPPPVFGEAKSPPAAEPSWAGPVPPSHRDFTAAPAGGPDGGGPDGGGLDSGGPLTLEPLPEPLDRWPDLG
ncbi:MAG TPA: hypothetical protein VMH35_27580 [Streptosporangiaceae bacterium]|nr:hypothetical protein [Streptosporangiaceae bacterium]